MTKIISLCLLLCACASGRNISEKENYIQFTYLEQGRNKLLRIEITEKQTSITRWGKEAEIRTTETTLWKQLQQVASPLTDSLITGTEPPSRKFQYDGALHTSLVFKKKDGTELSSMTFDHNEPPTIFREIISVMKAEANISQ